MKNNLWNMFICIQNGQQSHRRVVSHKRKKICENFLRILWIEGFILGYSIDEMKKNNINIFLKYKNNKPCISSLKFISKPGRRVYYSTKQIWKIDSSKSFIIFSTDKGLKSIIECKKLQIGGEPFVSIN